MHMDLFRGEVLSARRVEWLGSISLQAPRLGWFFFGFGLLVIVALMALLIGGRYTRHEQVDGALVPSSGLLTLMPVLPGVVEQVLVREGDRVRAGQPLIEISGEQDSAALGDTQSLIAAQLQLKRERLQADLVDQKRLTLLQQQNLQSRLAALQAQMVQLDDQVTSETQRAKSALALYKEWSNYVSNGVVSRLQWLQQHDTVLQIQSQIKELQEHHFQLQEQVVELQGQLEQLPATSASKLNEIDRQLADVAQSLSQNAAQRAIVLRAPADGTVVNILVHPGQSVTAQQSTLTVLPMTSVLLAELWVPPQAIGFIHAGEPVVIRYQAYPYQKFGQHTGHVREISRSALSPTEVSRLLGQDIKEPRYRVRVELDSQQVIAYGQVEALKPGMTLDADVLLDRRRLIEWVLEPLSGFASRMRGQSAPFERSING
jgi:membrane fusion protein